MKITEEIIESHGLKTDEYSKIKLLLNREPNYLELGIFSAMWNEHCSYKSSKVHLKKLEDLELIPFKYCNEKGVIDENNNPNGSLNNIAGIFNENKNILGMMPHPERMINKLFSGDDGINLFSSLMN